MTPQEIEAIKTLMASAEIELPVSSGIGHHEYRAEMIEAANGSMTIYDEGGHTKEQAHYIAHLLNAAPKLVAHIERLAAENRSYRNYIASAPDWGGTDHD